MLLTVLLSLSSQADEYFCLIERVETTPNYAEHVHKMYDAMFFNKSFTVSKLTGEFKGAFDSYMIKKPQIISTGSTIYPFAVNSVIKNLDPTNDDTQPLIASLHISEFNKRKRKPFILMINEMVYWGECKNK